MTSMMSMIVMAIRQLLAILILPVTVTVFIPIWITGRSGTGFTMPDGATELLLLLCGVAVLAVGLVLFGWSLFYFWTRGRGTLAPWDPPRHFVVDGPYRYVRNPMISGVIVILIGEALVLRSWPHARWAGLFALINLIYIPLTEEPMLEARFGEPYRRYLKAVRRFIPRLRPWTQDSAA